MSSYSSSNFYCSECGKRGLDIHRKKGQERAPGHLKKLYCLHCKKETNHVECKEFSKYDENDFIIEFNNNNFKNGERKIPYSELKRRLIKNGK